MNESKSRVLTLIKKIEDENSRCPFGILERNSEIKGDELADIVSSLYASGYIRIDNGDEDNLNRPSYRDIIRLWMTPYGIDAILES